MPMELVSVFESDKNSESPKDGDMVASNPLDNTDFWLVAEKFFKNNYELVR